MAHARQQLAIDGRDLSFSHLDKPLYPTGFTKGQAIDYYIRVADHLLPHLRNRPITLKRYPDGVQGMHFYEKDAPRYTPEWVQRFAVPRRGRTGAICYVLLNDLPSLLWSVNLANLEMHPFLHRIPDIDTPTSMVFDLDPGEGIGILQCAEVALLLKKALAADQYTSLAKVSGSKGIQVYAPLKTAVHYDQTKVYSRTLAERLERDHPELIVSAMAKRLRARKVFIDWSQNSDFKTTVAPYSLRARQDQPFVSLPVSWKELSDALKKGSAQDLYFTPKQALARIAKKKDLFAPLATRVPAKKSR